MKTACTVLVVDDNADLCTLIEDFLQTKNFDVVCARDGTEAFDVLDRRSIDLAVIDLLLPGHCQATRWRRAPPGKERKC